MYGNYDDGFGASGGSFQNPGGGMGYGPDTRLKVDTGGFRGMYGDADMVGGFNRSKFRKPGKREIIEWFKNYVGASELVLVDDMNSNVTRHVCIGGNSVDVLQKLVYNLPFPDGSYVVLEYFQCPKCRKVILDRNFM